jgi:hypothetical protein
MSWSYTLQSSAVIHTCCTWLLHATSLPGPLVVDKTACMVWTYNLRSAQATLQVDLMCIVAAVWYIPFLCIFIHEECRLWLLSMLWWNTLGQWCSLWRPPPPWLSLSNVVLDRRRFAALMSSSVVQSLLPLHANPTPSALEGWYHTRTTAPISTGKQGFSQRTQHFSSVKLF